MEALVATAAVIMIVALPLALVAAALATGGRPASGRRARRGNWIEPEHLAGQAQRDAALGRNRFYVYVLDTDNGPYVGHSYHVGRRFEEHRRGEVASTAGANPELIWTSRAFATRDEAASFEAAMKAMARKQDPRFDEITGMEW